MVTSMLGPATDRATLSPPNPPPMTTTRCRLVSIGWISSLDLCRTVGVRRRCPPVLVLRLRFIAGRIDPPQRLPTLDPRTEVCLHLLLRERGLGDLLGEGPGNPP